MFSELRFEIWVTFFLIKLSCKLNASVTVKFYRLENLKLKEKFKMRDFECFIFQSKFCFFQTFLGRFNHLIFWFLPLGQSYWRRFLLSPSPTIKTVPTAMYKSFKKYLFTGKKHNIIYKIYLSISNYFLN